MATAPPSCQFLCLLRGSGNTARRQDWHSDFLFLISSASSRDILKKEKRGGKKSSFVMSGLTYIGKRVLHVPSTRGRTSTMKELAHKISRRERHILWQKVKSIDPAFFQLRGKQYLMNEWLPKSHFTPNRCWRIFVSNYLTAVSKNQLFFILIFAQTFTYNT